VQLFDKIDLSGRLTDEEYTTRMYAAQRRLVELRLHIGGHLDTPEIGPGVLVVFEGSDAGGKGGAIKRIVEPLDPRHYRVSAFAKPSFDEKRKHFLWRFWLEVPGLGGMALFDRSWYGRVLVERVEGLCTVPDWMRAYDEINQFEEHLTEDGAIVVKFWLQISKAEQLARFKARERTSFKRFKITPEDWRNRRKWGAYERAVCDMVDRTSTEIAPWTLVEAEDKRYARIKVLTTIVDRLKEALQG
jgi:polyphosphate kinase 2 (PPK2 family)